MLFKKWVTCFTLLIGISCAAAYFFLIQVKPSDPRQYEKLMKESTSFRTRKALDKKPAIQTRDIVQKDLWILDGEERVHIQIKSEHSELTLKQNKDQFQAIEKLEEIDAYLLGSDGESKKLHANSGNLNLGEGVIDFEGVSGTFSISANESPFLFSCQTLKWNKNEKKINMEGNVHVEQVGNGYGNNGVHQELEKKVPLLAKDPIQNASPKEDRLGKTIARANRDSRGIHADSCFLTLKKGLSSEMIFFQGNVQCISRSIEGKENVSLSDEMRLDPVHQKLYLSAISPKRVLFWQEGFSLSAPEIQIQKDPITEKETVEGKGDIHFSFDLEEKNLIEQLLSKYL